MARIAGIDLPRNKRIDVALTYVHGIGTTSARQICAKAEVDGNTKTDLLGEGEVIRIREIVERDYQVEGDLRRTVTQNIKLLMDIGCPRTGSPRRCRSPR